MVLKRVLRRREKRQAVSVLVDKHVFVATSSSPRQRVPTVPVYVHRREKRYLWNSRFPVCLLASRRLLFTAHHQRRHLSLQKCFANFTFRWNRRFFSDVPLTSRCMQTICTPKRADSAHRRHTVFQKEEQIESFTKVRCGFPEGRED